MNMNDIHMQRLNYKHNIQTPKKKGYILFSHLMYLHFHKIKLHTIKVNINEHGYRIHNYNLNQNMRNID